MDERIRDLERRAAAGDQDAAQELLREQARAGMGCEVCGDPHPPLCPGSFDYDRASAEAEEYSVASLPELRGRPLRRDGQAWARLVARREEARARHYAFLHQAVTSPHRWGAWTTCSSCREFFAAHRGWIPEPGPSWRHSAARLVAIAKLTLPRGASKREIQAHLALYRLESVGGASWLNRMWQEEVRRAFPQLARKKVRAIAPDEPTPLFGGRP